MDQQIKSMIREEELISLEFFYELCEAQFESMRAFLLEQPRTSELLRIPRSMKLVSDTKCVDSKLCMCMHH